MSDLPSTVSWASLYAETRERLAGLGDHEARWIVEEASGLPATAWNEPATVGGVARLDRLVERRRAGEPLQYVLGHWSFRTLDLMVDRRVLIPRPETEELVGEVLAALSACSAAAGARPPLVCDLGTGSGAIALSVVAEHDEAEVWAGDRSPDALAVARANLASLGNRAAGRVRLVEGDWFSALPVDLRGRFDVIASNPPYVSPDEELPDEVARWEPVEALRSAQGGLADLSRLIGEARSWLRPDGVLILECAPHQADELVERAEAAGWSSASVRRDLSGRQRILTARR